MLTTNGQKDKQTPFFTTEMVTLFAPKGAKWHAAGQETKVQARQKDKFLKLGYRETKEDALETDAHPAIAVPQAPPAKPKKAAAASSEPETQQ